MALQKLPKQYHPDFRLPNKKPVGEVALDAKHSLFDSTLFDAEFINGNAIDLVTGRQLTNVGATWGATGEQETQYTANSHYAFSGLEKLSGKDYTVIVRARIDAYGPFGTIPFGWSNNGSAFFQIGDDTALWVAGRSATAQRAFNAADGVYRDYIFISDAGSNQVKVYFDNELLGQRSGAQSVSAGSKDIKIGKWAGGSNWPLEGGISRIQVLNKSLSDSEVRAYVKNRYSILKPKNDPVYFTSDAAGGGGTAQPLTLEQSQQLNQSELISVLSAQAFTLGLSEQVNQSTLSALTLNNVLASIQVEQLNQSNTLSIQQVAGQGLTLETTEQLNQSNTLSASQVAAISAEITEQINQSELIGIVSASAVILEATEQVNQSSTLEINQSDGQLLALTVVEQANQSTTLLVSQVGGLALNDSEQVNDSTAISLTQLAAINSLAVEQINQTNLLNIIQTGDLTDLKGIKFEPVSKVFALTEITKTYTLEEI